MNESPDAQESAPIPTMDEKTRMRFAAALRPARLEAGKTQDEVARAAGVARNTYAAMENGRTIPQAEKLSAAMLVLGLRPNPQSDDPQWLQDWLQIIRPLAVNLPEERRGPVMGRVIQTLMKG